MKHFLVRVMMCALAVALFVSGARADGPVTSATFGLTPNPASNLCVSTYNSAIGFGKISGRLAGNSLKLSASYTKTGKPLSDGSDFTNYLFTLALTGKQTIGEGDVFAVGSTVPSAQITISRHVLVSFNWKAVSGQVKVVSKSASALTLQLTDVVAQGGPLATTTRDRTTFNGPITVNFAGPNQAPTDLALSPASIVEKQAKGATVGALSATDADAGDTFTYALVAGEGDTDNSAFVISGTTLKTAQVFDAATKNSYSIRVRVTDAAGATFEKSFTITVKRENHAPVAQNTEINTAQGSAVSAQLSGTDADGDALTFASASNPTHGKLTLNANGAFSYAPNADFVGTDSFTFTANDGQSQSAPATVTITVVQGNRAPVLADASFNAPQKVSFSQQLAGTDADGDVLTYKVTAGTLPDGLNLSASGLIAGTPMKDGSSVATVEVSDGKGGTGTAQITIVVKTAIVPPTLAPTLTPVSPKTNDTLTVASNGNAASYSYVWKKNGTVIPSESAATLDLSKPGNGDKHDVITCEVTATNADGGAATATAQVTVVNSVPVAISSQGTVDAATEKGFVLQAFDADGDVLTYKRVGGPRNGMTADIRVDPTDGVTKLFYKSRPFYGGVDIIRFVVFDSDGKQSNESTLGINVLYTPPPPANRAPIAGDTNIDTYVGKSEVKGLLGSDPDGDAISFRIVGNAKYGTSEIKRDKDGVYKLFYTSLNRFYGNDAVTYIVTDSRGKESNLATVRINFINRAPIAQSNKIGVASGAPVSQYLFGTDEDGDALTFRLVNNPRYGKGEVKLDEQGKWRFYYQSLPGYVGPDQITFIAIDPQGKQSAVAAIDINVVRVNGAPSGGAS